MRGCCVRCLLPGTEIGHAATHLRACYAMSGTEIGYAATVGANLALMVKLQVSQLHREIKDNAPRNQRQRALRNQRQSAAFPVQFVPEMRFRGIDASV
eukprot:1678959-Rhodomonas_salina.1